MLKRILQVDKIALGSLCASPGRFRLTCLSGGAWQGGPFGIIDHYEEALNNSQTPIIGSLYAYPNRIARYRP